MPPLCYLTDEADADSAGAAVSLLTAGNAASMADVRDADCIALLDCDLLEEGPMLALAVRQAWRRGAQVFAVGSADSDKLAAIVSVPAERVAALEDVPFPGFTKPVLVSAARSSVSSPAVAAYAAAGGKLVCLLPGPERFRCGACCRAEHRAATLAEDVAAGKVKGFSPSRRTSLPGLFAGYRSLSLPTGFRRSWWPGHEIVLPTTAWLEMDGTFINNEGRAQRFKKAMNPGLPIRGSTRNSILPAYTRRSLPAGMYGRHGG